MKQDTDLQPNQQQPLVQPTSHPPHRHAQLIGIIGLVALLAYSALAYALHIGPFQPRETPLASTTPNPMANWQTYRNDRYGFDLKYPQTFKVYMPGDQMPGYIPPCQGNPFTCIFYNGNEYKNTNFDGAGLSVHIDPALNSPTLCSQKTSSQNDRPAIANRTINGITWSIFESGDAAAGHSSKDLIYNTFQNGNCYEVITSIGQSSFDNYDPSLGVKRFDDTALKAQLYQILSTFVFIQPTVTATPIPTKAPPKLSQDPLWSTYTNAHYGFVISYPAGLQIQEAPPIEGAGGFAILYTQAPRPPADQANSPAYPEILIKGDFEVDLGYNGNFDQIAIADLKKSCLEFAPSEGTCKMFYQGNNLVIRQTILGAYTGNQLSYLIVRPNGDAYETLFHYSADSNFLKNIPTMFNSIHFIK